MLAAATEENLALFFHLTGAFLLVSGTVVAGVAFESARRRHRVSEIALLLGLARVGVALVGSGSLLVVPFGLWLVHIEHVGYGATWVDAAFGLLIVVAVLGAVGGQVPKRARLLASGLDEGDASVELRALLDDPGARALNYCAAILLVAIVALMVFKPGGAA